jgi:predicted phosphodiesterase
MRLAIVTDVHGNLTALEAVIADLQRRGVERVVHGGDLALMGCQGAEVVDRIRELGWPGIVGNTDEVLWRPELHDELVPDAPGIAPVLNMVFLQYGPATRELLGEERVAWLRDLPAEHREDGLALVHASPTDLWRAPAPDAPDSELDETYGPLRARLTIYGHIHRPYIRTLGGLTVANTGSVGAPFDGNPRSSYLLVTDGVPELIRVEYDVEREAATLVASGYPDAPRIAEMRRQAAFLPLA